MALRIPGKGNFKPVRPTIRRPPVAPSSQPTPKVARPTIVTAPATQPAPEPATAPPTTAASALSTTAQAPTSSQPETSTASATPVVDTPVVEAAVPPRLLPSAILTSETKSEDTRKEREGSAFSAPPTPSAASPSPATTPRGPRKAKPLLAAAAASKTPTQRGTLREREKQKQAARAEREKIVEAQSSFRFTPTPRHSPAPGTPTGAWGPPTVHASHDGAQTNRSPTSSLHQSSDMWPPTVEASSAADAYATGLAASLPPIPAPGAANDFPPTVAANGAASNRSTPDPAVLAAALVASIKPQPSSAASGRKRQAGNKGTPDTDNTPVTSPKRRRTVRSGRAGTVDTVGTDDAEDADSEDGKPGRTTRGRYGTRGRAGTTADRRTTAFRRQAAIAQPELDGVGANDLVGEEVNESVMRMGDLATTLAAQGRVSARTIKLANFQRGEEERKLRERAVRTEKNWRRRQIVRRKARELRNNQREDRREAARARGDDPDAISADEVDSEVDYEIEPDRLTPPGSPRGPERIAPVRFEPEEEGEKEGEEGAEGAAPRTVNAGDEDIEGLGFVEHGSEHDEEIGETLEDFQLPVEEDPAGEAGAVNDFSGLEYNDYTGGYLDDEGNWVEGGATQAAAIHQRNEERRRRIMDGDHGQPVEIIDNETTFVNSATWGKKVSNDRWTSEETELFFAVLRETGENYTLMKAYFPGRTVRQLKNKGSRENRVNPQRMTDAIMNRKPMDKEYLAKSSGFNIDRPYDRENAFLDEVAREKDRVVAGLLPFGEEMEVQTGSWEANAIEFAVQA